MRRPSAFEGGRLAAAAFDMDGVIFDTERIYLEATRQALVGLGFPAESALLHSLIGLSSDECDLVLRSHVGSTAAFEELIEVYERARDEMLHRGLPVKEGARALLSHLRTAGLPVALVTGARKAVAVGYLERAGLFELFELIVTRDDVTVPKPAPDGYVAAAIGLGARPEQFIAFEDSGPGLTAAQAAGMRTILVPDLMLPAADVLDRCEVVLPNLHAALEYVLAVRS